MSNKRVVFDFDGVIHKYSRGWQDGSIYDEPVEGIENILKELKELKYDIVILSSRSKDLEGKAMIWDWLRKYNLSQYISNISITKPPAMVYVDDRAICFDGKCDTLVDQIVNFKTWNQKGE